MKNKRFKEKVERVLKKNIEFEKRIKSESDKTSENENENKSDDDIPELKDLFIVISTFFFSRSYELVSFSSQFHEFFFFSRFHELFFSSRSYELRSF